MHKLLARQLRKLGILEGQALSAENAAALLRIISRTYHDSDEDRSRLERSLDVSSAEMLERTATIRHQAFHDKLTNLPNRALFTDRLNLAMNRGRRKDTLTALMFIDLDNFKLINDSLGHEAGDRLLVAVAERLSRSVRPGDTVARLGGDEFTVLLEEVHNESEITQIAYRILDAFREPIALAGRDAFSSLSIGIGIAHSPLVQASDLLNQADAAMYRAKAAGGHTFVFYDPSMGRDAVLRLELETALRRSVEVNEISLAYQPLVDLRTRRFIGAEALARWRHPSGEFVPPSQFIPLAEETGLIIPIGAHVLEVACRQMQEWLLDGADPDVTIAVNVSVKQLERADIVDVVAETLARTQLAPTSLKLEVTESTLVYDRKDIVDKLRRLKALGVQLAVDDFGTGYSSLSNLSCFPVDTLKIDKSFVGKLETEEQARTIVEAIMTIARGMNKSVVGEGIESEFQRAMLENLGCAIGQGYLFAHPMSAAEFREALLSTKRAA